MSIKRSNEHKTKLTAFRRKYTGPRTKDLLDMLPAEDPEDVLSDYA